MLQSVHSPALGADAAAADLKLVQEQRPLVSQEVALHRGSQHVRAGHHNELVQAHLAGYHGGQAACQRSFALAAVSVSPPLVASSPVGQSIVCFWWTSALYHQQFTVPSRSSEAGGRATPTGSPPAPGLPGVACGAA